MSEDIIPFPDHFIRGIVQKKHIIAETEGVTYELFLPNTKTAQLRDDGGEEVSINWEDHDAVLQFTLDMKIENTGYLFPNGAVRLKKDELHRINATPTLENTITYERKKLPNNDYHGNIVYKNGLTDRVKKMIAYYIAATSSKVVNR